ncbi:MAG: pentapeptide repeat-containing protein, partial [Thermosynechococcaceae cyanobacterium]
MPQSFSQANLQGKSFKGQDLKGANFSCADIRGANFVHANLSGADLSGAKAGLTWRWVLLLAIGAICGAGLAGIICGYAGAFIGYIGAVADALKENHFSEPTALEFSIATGLPLGAMLLMGAILLRRGLGQTIAYSVAIATGLVLFATFSPDKPGLDRGDAIIPFLIGRPIMLLGALGGIAIGAIAIAVAIKVFPKTVFIAEFIAILGAIGGAIEAMTGAMTGSPIQSSTPEAMDWVFSGILTTCFLGCMTYIGLRACQGDKKYALIQDISSIISALGGTSFRGADLSDANFNQATLKSTDFRQAILARTHWHQARNLALFCYSGESKIEIELETKEGAMTAPRDP